MIIFICIVFLVQGVAQNRGMRQPHDMGGVNVKGFETTRTNERQVSPAKQGQEVEIFR